MNDDMGSHDIDGGRAWVVLVAAYTGNFIFTAIYFTSGVIYVELIQHFRDDVVKTSLIGSLNSSLLCLLGPITAFSINRYSCRVTAVFGGLVMGIACFISAFVTSIDWLIVSFGLLGGIGNSFAGIPPGVVTGYSFKKHRETVLAVASVMIGVGMLASSPMMIGVLKHYGLQGGFIILSGISLQLCVVGVLLKPSSLEKQINRQRALLTRQTVQLLKEKLPPGKSVCGVYRCLEKLDKLFHINILKSAVFDLFLFSTMTWNLMTAICQIHLPNYMTVQGESSSHVALVMALFGVANTLGRVFGTVTVSFRHKIDLFYWQIIFLLVSGITACMFSLFKELPSSEILFSVTIGFCTGGTNCLLTPLMLHILEVEHLSAGYGMAFFSSGVGFLIGAPIASALFNNSNAYNSSFIFAGCVSILGSIFAALAFIKQRNTAKDVGKHPEPSCYVIEPVNEN